VLHFRIDLGKLKQTRMNFIIGLIAIGKQKRYLLVLAGLWMAFSPWQARAAFTNAGFESNSFASWTINSSIFGSVIAMSSHLNTGSGSNLGFF